MGKQCHICGRYLRCDNKGNYLECRFCCEQNNCNPHYNPCQPCPPTNCILTDNDRGSTPGCLVSRNPHKVKKTQLEVSEGKDVNKLVECLGVGINAVVVRKQLDDTGNNNSYDYPTLNECGELIVSDELSHNKLCDIKQQIMDFTDQDTDVPNPPTQNYLNANLNIQGVDVSSDKGDADNGTLRVAIADDDTNLQPINENINKITQTVDEESGNIALNTNLNIKGLDVSSNKNIADDGTLRVAIADDDTNLQPINENIGYSVKEFKSNCNSNEIVDTNGLKKHNTIISGVDNVSNPTNLTPAQVSVEGSVSTNLKVDDNALDVGSGIVNNTLRVTIADDDTNLLKLANTYDDESGNNALNTNLNISGVDANVGQGDVETGTLRVTIADDDTNLLKLANTYDVNGNSGNKALNTNLNIKGVDLTSGAGNVVETSSVTQRVTIADDDKNLSSINDKLTTLTKDNANGVVTTSNELKVSINAIGSPAVGQKPSAQSLPVVLPHDQLDEYLKTTGTQNGETIAAKLDTLITKTGQVNLNADEINIDMDSLTKSVGISGSDNISGTTGVTRERMLVVGGYDRDKSKLQEINVDSEGHLQVDIKSSDKLNVTHPALDKFDTVIETNNYVKVNDEDANATLNNIEADTNQLITGVADVKTALDDVNEKLSKQISSNVGDVDATTQRVTIANDDTNLAPINQNVGYFVKEFKDDCPCQDDIVSGTPVNKHNTVISGVNKVSNPSKIVPAQVSVEGSVSTNLKVSDSHVSVDKGTSDTSTLRVAIVDDDTNLSLMSSSVDNNNGTGNISLNTNLNISGVDANVGDGNVENGTLRVTIADNDTNLKPINENVAHSIRNFKIEENSDGSLKTYNEELTTDANTNKHYTIMGGVNLIAPEGGAGDATYLTPVQVSEEGSLSTNLKVGDETLNLRDGNVEDGTLRVTIADNDTNLAAINTNTGLKGYVKNSAGSDTLDADASTATNKQNVVVSGVDNVSSPTKLNPLQVSNVGSLSTNLKVGDETLNLRDGNVEDGTLRVTIADNDTNLAAINTNTGLKGYVKNSAGSDTLDADASTATNKQNVVVSGVDNVSSPTKLNPLQVSNVGSLSTNLKVGDETLNLRDGNVEDGTLRVTIADNDTNLAAINTNTGLKGYVKNSAGSDTLDADASTATNKQNVVVSGVDNVSSPTKLNPLQVSNVGSLSTNLKVGDESLNLRDGNVEDGTLRVTIADNDTNLAAINTNTGLKGYVKNSAGSDTLDADASTATNKQNVVVSGVDNVSTPTKLNPLQVSNVGSLSTNLKVGDETLNLRDGNVEDGTLRVTIADNDTNLAAINTNTGLKGYVKNSAGSDTLDADASTATNKQNVVVSGVDNVSSPTKLNPLQVSNVGSLSTNLKVGDETLNLRDGNVEDGTLRVTIADNDTNLAAINTNTGLKGYVKNSAGSDTLDADASTATNKQNVVVSGVDNVSTPTKLNPLQVSNVKLVSLSAIVTLNVPSSTFPSLRFNVSSPTFKFVLNEPSSLTCTGVK